MDVSDQHVQQSSHGPVSHTLLPLNYIHNLQTVDNHSPLIPNYTLIQPPLIISSSSLMMGDHKPAINHFSASYRPATPLSSPSLSTFNAGNMNIDPTNCNSGLDHLPGKQTFDYGFNQIYDDQLQFFEIPGGSDRHQSVHSTGQSKNTQKPIQHENATTPAELNVSTNFFTNGPFSSQAGQMLSSSGGDVLKSELGVGVDSFAPILTQRSSVSGYPFASNGSFLHSLVDMESLKEEAYSNDHARSGADSDHEPARMPSTSTPADYHLLDFSNFPSFSSQDMPVSHRSCKGNAINETRPTSSNPLAPCSNVSAGTEGAALGMAVRGKAQTAPKRRKLQQKRVVCVPATGGVERPTGECLPSDSWAWRKYGQKPIKNSPYPRSYYKCSSVKGCTARKQVERNPSDPMMIIITYTVEHSHPAPTEPPKPALDESEGDDKQINTDDTQINDAHISNTVDRTDATSEESCEPISSEGNLNDISNEEVMISDSDRRKVEEQQQQEQAQLQDSTVIEDDDHVGLFPTTPTSATVSCSSGLLQYPFGSLKSRSSSKADDDFFAQLGELPDLFGKNSAWPGAQCEHHNQSSAVTPSSSAAHHDTGSIPIISTHINIDPFDLYYWP
ncbi:hypothetical protein GOP47_0002493 [Adiantum capillus-veneris]|uniref:WRKY domain-containing protein n=1 Tax=Adiantum capillus-veneris TaxID=13818 RepID=A0A9D4ZRP0_ADICA|nr:hypothetical protein GOP47_0002493 [Adiantum capillus-veneris]